MKKNLPIKFFTVFLFLLLAGVYTFAQSTVFISQIADPADHYQGRYVQLYNSGSTAVDLSAENYYLVKQIQTGTISDIALTGTIQPGGVYVIAGYSDFATYYGFDPDQQNGNVNQNGDDAYFLYIGGDHTSGTLIDVYGIEGDLGITSSSPWWYQDGVVTRNSNIGTGNTTWTASEWTINLGANTTDLDPSTHTYNSSSDVTPPEWVTGYPDAPIIEDTHVVLSTALNEMGVAYFIIVAHNSTAPTSAEVKAGVDYSGVQVYVNDSIVVATANTPYEKPLWGATPNTTYDVWFVARDAAGNIQSTPTKLTETTTDSRSLSLTEPQENDEVAIGDTLQISWTASNIDSVMLMVYSLSDHKMFPAVDHSIPASQESYKLGIPYDADSGFYTFYIVDRYDTAFYDSVTPVHVIESRRLSWVKPLDNDTFYVGDTVTFQWTSSNIDSVLIGGYNYTVSDAFMITGDLDHNDAAYWKPVAASKGSYKFFLDPDKVGGNFTLAMKIYDAKDTSFNAVSVPVYIVDTLPLKLTSSAPTAGMTDFPAAAAISCTFSSDSIKPGTGKLYIKNSDGSTYESVDASSLEIHGNNFYFMPNPQLIAGNSYYIQMDSGLVQTADESKAYKGLDNDSLSFTVATTSLIFSEYIEGSSNNKALEVYNNTGHDINLGDYAIGSANNGNLFQGDLYYFPAGTILQSGKVFVLANSSASEPILSVADDTLAWSDGGYVMGFNGNDARVLIRVMNNGADWAWIDVIGTPGDDPSTGWDVAGVSAATKDHTLLRKADVSIGTTDWATSAGTDADNSQWIVKDIDYFSNLGQPTETQGINNIKLANQVKLYPNPGNGIFNINLNNTMKGSIVVKVMDVTGRVILEKSFNQTPNTIPVNISSFAPNMYFVQINDKNNVVVKRFIKR